MKKIQGLQDPHGATSLVHGQTMLKGVSHVKQVCHCRYINTSISHDLSEEHTKGNMVLLHFRVEFFLESLYSVEEDDFG